MSTTQDPFQSLKNLRNGQQFRRLEPGKSHVSVLSLSLSFSLYHSGQIYNAVGYYNKTTHFYFQTLFTQKTQCKKKKKKMYRGSSFFYLLYLPFLSLLHPLFSLISLPLYLIFYHRSFSQLLWSCCSASFLSLPLSLSLSSPLLLRCCHSNVWFGTRCVQRLRFVCNCVYVCLRQREGEIMCLICSLHVKVRIAA